MIKIVAPFFWNKGTNNTSVCNDDEDDEKKAKVKSWGN
jgi:hypothetical protein